jgi:hypothetical protein
MDFGEGRQLGKTKLLLFYDFVQILFQKTVPEFDADEPKGIGFKFKFLSLSIGQINHLYRKGLWCN